MRQLSNLCNQLENVQESIASTAQFNPGQLSPFELAKLKEALVLLEVAIPVVKKASDHVGTNLV